MLNIFEVVAAPFRVRFLLFNLMPVARLNKNKVEPAW